MTRMTVKVYYPRQLIGWLIPQTFAASIAQLFKQTHLCSFLFALQPNKVKQFFFFREFLLKKLENQLLRWHQRENLLTCRFRDIKSVCTSRSQVWGEAWGARKAYYLSSRRLHDGITQGTNAFSAEPSQLGSSLEIRAKGFTFLRSGNLLIWQNAYDSQELRSHIQIVFSSRHAFHFSVDQHFAKQ